MNRESYFDYNGEMPPRKLWCPEQMSDEKRSQFDTWYNDRVETGYRFNFKKELIDYCLNDVEILRLSANSFQKEFIATTGIDPFARNITMPSACMAVFRTHFLKENTIAVIGDEKKTTAHSKKSIHWLLYKELTDGVTLKHARIGEEVKIGPYRVDGYDETTDTIYKFMGCFWHGCPHCFARKTFNKKQGRTMGELYDQTRKRIQKLKAMGKKVVYIWEHEWDMLVKENPEAREVVDSFQFNSPLSPKEGFYDGQTQAIRPHYSEDIDGGKAKYLDFMSL